MLQAAVAAAASRRASATPSSPAPAASRKASMPASTAASARTTRRDKVAENRARMAAALGVAPERSSPPIRSIRPTWWSPRAVDAREPPARRCHRHPHAGARDRRVDRRLRAAAVGRQPRRGVIGAAHAGWRGALHRRDRGDGRRHGEARRRARAHRGRARPHDPAAELRGRAGIRRAFPGSRRRTTSASSRRRSAPATPCSISPATSPRGLQRAGIATIRRSRPLHLRRAGALLQLPPHDPSRRARLRPAYQRHRARRVVACIRHAARVTGHSGVSTATLDCGPDVRNDKNKTARQGCRCRVVGGAPGRGARRMWRVWRRCYRPLSRVGARRLQSDDHARPAFGRPAARRHRRLRIDRRPAARQFQSSCRSSTSEAQTRRLAVMSRDGPRPIACAAISPPSGGKRRPRSPGCGTCSTTTAAARCASPARKTAQGPTTRRLGRRRRRHAAADRPHQHGAARRLPDLARSRAGTPDASRMALAAARQSSPEAAGISRIFRADADPAPGKTATCPPRAGASAVPLPPRRAAPTAAAVSARAALDRLAARPIVSVRSPRPKCAGTTNWTRIAGPLPALL